MSLSSPDVTPASLAFNAVIRARARARSPLSTLALYRAVVLRGSPIPDTHTFPLVLKACAFLLFLPVGSQIHAHITKLGLHSHLHVANSLIHFYASCGRLHLARDLFDRMPHRSPVSWNALVDGYVAIGHHHTALELVRDMQLQASFPPDGFTLQSIVGASAALAAPSLVIWAHAFLLKRCHDSIASDVLMNNSFIHAYSKCGSIALACQVFDRMPRRDLASWNAIILGLAMHGEVEAALRTFRRMPIKPNSITFVGVLSACNHGGLVAEGRGYFHSMVSEHGIEPRIEHFGCMVDLLARAGFINEALDFALNRMPCKPDAVIWRSLLDACCRNNAGIELSMSKSMAMRALESESEDSSGVYVLLSRVYALANRWDEVGLVRKMMTDEGIKKEPGCSSIELDGVLHDFVAGDTSHPRSKEIYEALSEVEHRLASVGYKPDSSQASMVAEVDGGTKGDALRLHSERLALALGLLNMKPGVPIQIMKNLRVCRDCHAMTKLVSRVYGVEIVMRDRARFHRFKDGSCSCMDYW